uniref:Uncharacterized protein n=1 Tax=Dunaliella tertiolecta TaxID=3047 RepID=A0A7S3R9Q7_DUNTE|eukprot:631917-Pelagomonas_calceolata.AAC.1
MEAHPGEGQRSLALVWLFKRPHTQEDGPLLSIKQTRFTPEVQAGMQQQELEMELKARAARVHSLAVRPNLQQGPGGEGEARREAAPRMAEARPIERGLPES